MVLVLLAAKYMPTRQHYAPKDAVALERYGILKRVVSSRCADEDGAWGGTVSADRLIDSG